MFILRLYSGYPLSIRGENLVRTEDWPLWIPRMVLGVITLTINGNEYKRLGVFGTHCERKIYNRWKDASMNFSAFIDSMKIIRIFPCLVNWWLIPTALRIFSLPPLLFFFFFLQTFKYLKMSTTCSFQTNYECLSRESRRHLNSSLTSAMEFDYYHISCKIEYSSPQSRILPCSAAWSIGDTATTLII